MTTLRFDASDFVALSRDLDRAADGLLDEVQKTVARSAGNVKATMREDMRRSRSFRQVAEVIDYDLDRFTSSVRAEVGARTAGKGVGDLAHFAYFGGSPGGGGTVPDPEYLVARETEDLDRFIGRILEGLL